MNLCRTWAAETPSGCSRGSRFDSSNFNFPSRLNFVNISVVMKPSARTLYSLLCFYIAANFTYYSANIVSLVDGFWAHHARLAFQIDFERLTLTELKPEATEAGLAEGDQIVSL